MSTENSHPLVQLLAGQIQTKEQAPSEAIRSLEETLRLIGAGNISHIDLNNIADIVDVSAVVQGEQQAVPQPVTVDNPDEQFHVFARTNAVRSTQLAGGLNQFLAGTISNTIGPFIINDRPPFWIDFIRIQRSVALFVQGNPAPIMYFKINVNIFGGLIFTIPKQNTYQIIPTSVWVQAKLLHAFAPADLYAGLKVSSGTLKLSGNFTTNQTGIILGPGSNFSCQLNLVQKARPANAPAGQYGKDARDATIQLPVEFSFTNNGIVKVGGVSSTVFGNSLSAPENTQPNTKYFAQQKRLGISLNVNEDPIFNIDETQSPLVDINGQANITSMWWALPLAQIQLMQPLEAEGNGALLVECADGLFANIKGTTKDEISLIKPQFLIEPGRINMTDISSNGAGKSHSFSLWQEADKFVTEATVNFLKEAPIVFNTLSQGDEVLSTVTGFTIDADRPVNIRGEAVALRTEKG
ncbi:MAG: hypothetical protein ABIN67_10980, partial [Ferruginibacter sp.]